MPSGAKSRGLSLVSGTLGIYLSRCIKESLDAGHIVVKIVNLCAL